MTETKDDLRFGDALDELETILERIESEETDIDSLAEELKRAATLLEVCRGKIRRAEVEVSQIVQTLGDDSDPDAEDALAAAPTDSED